MDIGLFQQMSHTQVGQTCSDMQDGPQEPGLDCILHWLKTLLIVLLTSKRYIRFLIPIIYEARAGKRKFLYMPFSLVELTCFV